MWRGRRVEREQLQGGGAEGRVEERGQCEEASLRTDSLGWIVSLMRASPERRRTDELRFDWQTARQNHKLCVSVRVCVCDSVRVFVCMCYDFVIYAALIQFDKNRRQADRRCQLNFTGISINSKSCRTTLHKHSDPLCLLLSPLSLLATLLPPQ